MWRNCKSEYILNHIRFHCSKLLPSLSKAGSCGKFEFLGIRKKSATCKINCELETFTEGSIVRNISSLETCLRCKSLRNCMYWKSIAHIRRRGWCGGQVAYNFVYSCCAIGFDSRQWPEVKELQIFFMILQRISLFIYTIYSFVVEYIHIRQYWIDIYIYIYI